MNVGILCLACLVLVGPGSADTMAIETSWKDDKFQVLDHFWRNTGLSPPGDADARRKLLLSRDEQLNLALIGAVPNDGITHVRIHWILDLVSVQELTHQGPVFDYHALDTLIDWLHRHGLAPAFELMGNPSGYFTDFAAQSRDWQRLIKEIIGRYIDKYDGLYLYKWRFELTNEPDLRMYNAFNFTLPRYLDYFRSTESALGRLLGPAGLFRENREAHPLCWGLLSHCNFHPCNLWMITYHRKGDGVASRVVSDGLNLIRDIRNGFGNLTRSGIAFGNDEADIMTGWNHPAEWRADVRYASAVVQVVIGHINEMRVERDIRFELLSNDNAFLSYYPNQFTQRTLLARFQMNDTNPPHVQFFRKPVYAAMGLLSLLGSYVMDIRYTPGERGLSYILTGEKWRINFLGTINNDRVEDEGSGAADVSLTVEVQPTDDARAYAVYVLDNTKTCPYHVWKSAGSPDFPDMGLRRIMRQSEELKRVQLGTLSPSETRLTVTVRGVQAPTILSVNLCDAHAEPPGPVEGLHYVKIKDGEVLLLWSDEFVKSKCVLTYEVEFRRDKRDKFVRINEMDTLFLSYHFDGWVKGAEMGVRGEYRVAVVDYFKRRGQYSYPIYISDL